MKPFLKPCPVCGCTPEYCEEDDINGYYCDHKNTKWEDWGHGVWTPGDLLEPEARAMWNTIGEKA